MDNKTMRTAAALAALAMAAGCSHMNSGPKAMAAGEGECYGVNSCKGTGACGGPGHSCAGQNSCKGQGWLALTPSACDAKHGTFKKG